MEKRELTVRWSVRRDRCPVGRRRGCEESGRAAGGDPVPPAGGGGDDPERDVDR